MSDSRQDEEQNDGAHLMLREPLLDLLYRLEKMESAVDPNRQPLTRIPSVETAADQDAVLTDMAVRLAALERELED